MLIESTLAIISIITAAYLTQDKFAELIKFGPTNVFADGLGTFMASFGINQVVGKTFAALAVSAFAMTTLDTATRLGRFAFQEFLKIYRSLERQWHLLTLWLNSLVTGMWHL